MSKKNEAFSPLKLIFMFLRISYSEMLNVGIFLVASMQPTVFNKHIFKVSVIQDMTSMQLLGAKEGFTHVLGFTASL